MEYQAYIKSRNKFNYNIIINLNNIYIIIIVINVYI